MPPTVTLTVRTAPEVVAELEVLAAELSATGYAAGGALTRSKVADLLLRRGLAAVRAELRGASPVAPAGEPGTAVAARLLVGVRRFEVALAQLERVVEAQAAVAAAPGAADGGTSRTSARIARGEQFRRQPGWVIESDVGQWVLLSTVSHVLADAGSSGVAFRCGGRAAYSEVRLAESRGRRCQKCAAAPAR